MAKHNRTGRSKGQGRFVAFPFSLADTEAWRNLSGLAAKAWLEVMRRYNGSNNGMIAVPTRDLAKRIGVSHVTASRVLLELENAGFIRLVKASSFGLKRAAAEYRLTHLPSDVDGSAPTHEYRRTGAASNVVPIATAGERARKIP
jgi:DNA-binding IscR family transcriptional regulator